MPAQEITTSEIAQKKSDAWTDLGLTLPIFIAYHLGVVFLPVRNAADPVTSELRVLANHSMLLYAGLTLGIGAAFVIILAVLGKRETIQKKKFVFIAIEGALYACLMRFAGAYVIGSLRLGPPGGNGGVFTSVVMSLGAGFYEEIAFRVGIFGVGAFVIQKLLGKGVRGILLTAVWAVIGAAVFSGWHYVGPLSDAWNLQTFLFRAVCGLCLTAIYAFRGFAPAVWTHALYDIWAMILH